ncbi:hypothetical protein [uncultured Aliiroseovarius sp.]|uniref:hypothetical protein n=1 Tax=uncultured Aliiroseovarius sp. TaxID=1658783 RepID=UPI0026278C45|nr:hypothetical protein [uncultured Aliiroseovarius sp.]
MKKLLAIGLLSISLTACEMTAPEIEHASKHSIAIRYTAWDVVPTLSAEAIDIAVSHCKKYGLHANYRGANVPNALSAEEIHVFVCEPRKTDDNAVIAAQNKRYSDMYSASMTAAALAGPTYTNCSTYGYQTICTSY